MFEKEVGLSCGEGVGAVALAKSERLWCVPLTSLWCQKLRKFVYWCTRAEGTAFLKPVAVCDSSLCLHSKPRDLSVNFNN